MPRLRHSNPSGPGFHRIRRGDDFVYRTDDGDPVPDADLARIRALAIPPAWEEVWICPWPNGHIQAIGTDAAGRRQYRYHEVWRQRKDREKFDRMLLLARNLPAARRQVTLDLREERPTQRRTLAAAFRILDRAAPRVGSETYLETHGSRGLSTILCRHVSVEGHLTTFGFVGKAGQRWEAVIDDADLALVLAQLAARSPRSRLLAWQRGAAWRPVSAAAINDYVRQVTGGEFTAKDFRTLRGTIAAAQSLRESLRAESERTSTPRSGRMQAPRSKRVADRAISAAMRAASAELGNTPAVARASYVDPRVVDRYRTGRTLPPTGSPEHALVDLIED